MIKRLCYRVALVFALAVLFAATLKPISAQAVSPKSYTVTDLGVLSGNTSFKDSLARGINFSGAIVGSSYKDEINFTSVRHAVKWDTLGNIFDVAVPFFPAADYNCNMFAINDSGEMAGTIANIHGVNGGHLLPYIFHPDGTITPLSIPDGADTSYQLKINNNNIILGSWRKFFVDGNGNYITSGSSCLWTLDGVRTDLTDLAGYNPSSINDNGIIVGSFGNDLKPFLWDSIHGARFLSSTGATAFANDINNSGVVGGADGGHATLWTGGIPKDIHAFGSSSRVFLLNNIGQAILTSSFPAVTYNCLYDGAQTRTLISMTPVSSPFIGISAYGVNDQGQIVGQGFTTSGNFFSAGHAILLTPTNVALPHPSEVTASIQSSISSLVYSPITKLWVKRLTLTNTGSSAIMGPFYCVLSGLPLASQSLMSPALPKKYFSSGPQIGNSYFTIPGNLTPGGSVNFDFSFSLPALRSGTNFTIPTIYAGPGRP